MPQDALRPVVVASRQPTEVADRELAGERALEAGEHVRARLRREGRRVLEVVGGDGQVVGRLSGAAGDLRLQREQFVEVRLTAAALGPR